MKFSGLKPFVQTAVLLGLLFFSYSPSLKNNFILDDPLWIPSSQQSANKTFLARTWSNPLAFEAYQPITTTTYRLDYQAE